MNQMLSSANSNRRTLMDLLGLIIGNIDSIDRNAIKTELYLRLNKKFHDRLYKIGNKLFSGLPDIKTRIKDVFQDTFLIAFEQIGNFEIKDNWSEKECEKVLLFWLGKIANNLLLNICKDIKKEKEVLCEYEYRINIDNLEGTTCKRNYKPTYDRTKFTEVINHLNPMAKEVLFACLEYDTLNVENTKHLPDLIIEKITAKYGVTPSAVRKAKERTIKKILACKLEN